MGDDHYDGIHPKVQIDLQPNIGLDDHARKSVVGLLNKILADEAVLTIKTRSAHWNVHGVNFSELYNLYDNQYIGLNAISDVIAERVRMLGGFTTGSLREYLNHTRLGEQSGDSRPLLQLLADHEATIRFLREDANHCFEEYEDVGTFHMLAEIIRHHEKMAWMLRSYIDEG